MHNNGYILYYLNCSKLHMTASKFYNKNFDKYFTHYIISVYCWLWYLDRGDIPQAKHGKILNKKKNITWNTLWVNHNDWYPKVILFIEDKGHMFLLFHKNCLEIWCLPVILLCILACRWRRQDYSLVQRSTRLPE